MDARCRTAWPGRTGRWVAGGVLAVAAVAAQAAVDQALMMRYGGVLAADCSNYLLPQLKYLGDTLVVQDGGKPVLTGRNVKPAPRHFGATPPAGFETALTSSAAGGTLVFVFYRTPQGVFAAVEGSPQVIAALPASLRQGQRVRHCDPNRNAVPGSTPAGPLGPPDLLKDARFRQPYLQALGPLARERWLARLDGPAPPLRTVKVGGTDYQLASVCKPHDCHDHNAVLLYAAPAQAVYGRVVQRGQATLLGAPPAPVAAELERLWRTEWRSGR